jgi:hypothetical protein
MSGINLKHTLATVAVAAGLLAGAGSASAATHQSGVIAYNGHAGLGASAYQHDQTDLEFSIDIGTSENIAADGLRAGLILMADSGGQFYSARREGT